MSEVAFVGVRRRFGATLALDGFDVEVRSGELVCLLGPSGCGKTTALRILAGFETADAGDVLVGGRSVLGTDARHRGFGVVFQSYSLFPNMTARRNIGFALHLRGVRGRALDRRVDELLDLTRLSLHADKYPHQLSGGQQQRVALARAIATEPPVLLLDEPLSALDAAVREQLRDEIRRLQRRVGITTVFVTHDQHEAMAVADRIGVMHAGRLVQLGPPGDVYARPVDAFVSTFLGTSNEVPVVTDAGRVEIVAAGGADGGRVEKVHVRPEHLGLRHPDGPRGTPATVTGLTFLGALTRVECDLHGRRVVVDLPTADTGDVRVGDPVRVEVVGPVSRVS